MDILSEVCRLSEGRDIKVLSFDIFDTLIFRTVGQPFQVFEQMYGRTSALNSVFNSKEEWRRHRVWSEEKTRQDKDKLFHTREVSIEEIYQTARVAENIIQYEIQAEKECCFLNPVMADVITKIKEQYKTWKIILASDMYLGKKYMVQILKTVGFEPLLSDAVYISGELEKSKATGTLYQYICEDIGIQPEEMIHIGDNQHSDVKMAEAAGVHAIWYKGKMR